MREKLLAEWHRFLAYARFRGMIAFCVGGSVGAICVQFHLSLALTIAALMFTALTLGVVFNIASKVSERFATLSGKLKGEVAVLLILLVTIIATFAYVLVKGS